MRISQVVKPWRFPEASERALARSMQQAVDQAVEVMKFRAARLKFDATDEEIEKEENEAEAEIIAIFLGLLALVSKLGWSIYTFNTQQFLIMAMSTGGKDNPAVALLNQTGAKGLEPWLQEKTKLWQTSTQNALVKLARDIFSDWSSQIRLAAQQEQSAEVVQERLKLRYSAYSGWSANRASGIIGTFNSALMKQRLKDVNVSRYIWRGRMDDRERDSHIALEKKSRDVSEFPFPGEEYNCRCWAVPDWKSRYR